MNKTWQPKILVGTSGYGYDHWRGLFYPEKLAKAKWLEFYATHFSTVELNNPFYRLPSEEAFTRWRDSSPADFVFALKVSRFITHIKRLKDTGEAVGTFISRAKILGEKLGPLLYQLPPSMHRDDKVLASFLSSLPEGLKHVVEFRHPSWIEDGVFQILREYNIGLCIFDMPDFTCPVVATADFAYVRFHGSTALYSSSYPDEELADWADKLTGLVASLKEVYIYFNNDVGGFAIDNARSIGGYLQSDRI
ncbi:MAG: DUF72 domain-containing protein [Dehalococcoidia bacterium]|nr:MAG: DUF72 domain-containing protein [Dehalococcoidia bacterium]